MANACVNWGAETANAEQYRLRTLYNKVVAPARFSLSYAVACSQ